MRGTRVLRRAGGGLLSVCGAALMLHIPAWGATHRLDETGTVLSQRIVQMKWRHPVPGRVGDDTIEGTVRVDLRLNLQPWLNRPARIYMVLGPVANAVTARWSTQGRLLPGTLRSGQRTLVFDGTAGPAVLGETLLMTLEADGGRAVDLQHLHFHFEIEVSP